MATNLCEARRRRRDRSCSASPTASGAGIELLGARQRARHGRRRALPCSDGFSTAGSPGTGLGAIAAQCRRFAICSRARPRHRGHGALRRTPAQLRCAGPELGAVVDALSRRDRLRRRAGRCAHTARARRCWSSTARATDRMAAHAAEAATPLLRRQSSTQDCVRAGRGDPSRAGADARRRARGRAHRRARAASCALSGSATSRAVLVSDGQAARRMVVAQRHRRPRRAAHPRVHLSVMRAGRW